MNTTADNEATAAKAKAAELTAKLVEHARAMTELRGELREHADTLTKSKNTTAVADAQRLRVIADKHKEACDAFAKDAQARVGPTA